MGRKIKKGTKGNAAQYLTRTQAVRKLQLRLSDFRRLCILKGVHPREPKKKPKGANKTYYHAKDINFLAHEPLLITFRTIKAHARKVKKARAKQNLELAHRLAGLTPKFQLDHLVKERYPSFVDALRDLDDPLTLVNLFATLPAEKKLDIPLEAVQNARRLALEWQAYVVRASALRRVFVSVKGYYFQAEIAGQSVTWLTPHVLSQVLPADVDFRVMVTFLEFYNTLLQFINFKLYHTLGLRYPPLLDPKLESAAAELAGIMKSLAGLRDAAEGDRAVSAAGAIGSSADASAAGAGPAPSENEAVTQARMKSLHARLREIVGQGDDDDVAAKAGISGGGDGEGSDDDEEVDSEADSQDDDNEPFEIDSGGEDQESSSSSDEEDAEALAERQRSGAGASSRSSKLLESDDEDAALGLSRLRSDDADESDADESAPSSRQRGAEDDAGRLAAGGALGAGVDPNDEASVCGSLFAGCIFYLAREVPKEPLMLVIRAFGGSVAWDGEGSPVKEGDERITHQVVDRPTQGHRFLSRDYVQPQWVFDSANFRVHMPMEMYVPGKAPPPHLSPFVGEDDDGYTPDFAKTVKRLQDAARAARLRAAGLAALHGTTTGEEGEDFVGEGAHALPGSEANTHMQAGGGDEDEEAVEASYRADLAKELRAAGRKRSAVESEEPSDPASEAGDEEALEEDDEASGSEDEEAEAAAPPAAKAAAGKRKKISKAEQEAAEEAAMADIMMTRKAKKMYQGLQARAAAKQQRVESLEAKKAALEKMKGQKGKGAAAAAPAPAQRPAKRGKA